MKVVQVATAQDIGKALNPLAVTGQIEGGIAQGVGLAVMEEIVVDGSRIRNPSFTDYLLPTPLDMPPVEQTWIEQPERGAPYGAKGVGRAADDLLDRRGARGHPAGHGAAAEPDSNTPGRHRAGPRTGSHRLIEASF